MQSTLRKGPDNNSSSTLNSSTLKPPSGASSISPTFSAYASANQTKPSSSSSSSAFPSAYKGGGQQHDNRSETEDDNNIANYQKTLSFNSFNSIDDTKFSQSFLYQNMKKRLEELEETVLTSAELMEFEKTRTKELSSKLASLESDHSTIYSQNQEMSYKLEHLSTDYEILLKENESLKATMQKYNLEGGKLQSLLTKATDDVAIFQDTKTKLEKALKDKNDECEELLAELIKTKVSVGELNGELDETKKALRKLTGGKGLAGMSGGGGGGGGGGGRSSSTERRRSSNTNGQGGDNRNTNSGGQRRSGQSTNSFSAPPSSHTSPTPPYSSAASTSSGFPPSLPFNSGNFNSSNQQRSSFVNQNQGQNPSSSSSVYFPTSPSTLSTTSNYTANRSSVDYYSNPNGFNSNTPYGSGNSNMMQPPSQQQGNVSNRGNGSREFQNYNTGGNTGNASSSGVFFPSGNRGMQNEGNQQQQQQQQQAPNNFGSSIRRGFGGW
jgi:hypothetical protein